MLDGTPGTYLPGENIPARGAWQGLTMIRRDAQQGRIFTIGQLLTKANGRERSAG